MLDQAPAPDLERLIAVRARHLASVPGALGSEDPGASRRATIWPVQLLAAVAILALAIGVAALMQWRLVGPLRQVRPSPSSTPTSLVEAPAGTVVFSGSACAYEGPQRIWVDHVSMALSNRTAKAAHFDFFRLNEGHGYLEFATYIQEEQRRSQAGLAYLGYPNFATFLFTDVVNPQETQSLVLPTNVATYVIACIPWNEGQPADIYAAGPLTVSP